MLQHGVGEQVSNVDRTNQPREGLYDPLRIGLGRPSLHLCQKLPWSPSDPTVARGHLNDGAAKRGDSDHWMIRRSAITHEEPHFPSRSALIGARPRVAEIPPDVRQ